MWLAVTAINRVATRQLILRSLLPSFKSVPLFCFIYIRIFIYIIIIIRQGFPGTILEATAQIPGTAFSGTGGSPLALTYV